MTEEARHVEDPGTLSPSQLEAWNSCKRLWGFTYISGLRPEGKGGAALGSAIHKQREKYLHGEPMDFTAPNHAADIAAVGTNELPEPNTPGLKIEKAFKFVSSTTGISYRGFVDFSIPPEHRDGIPLIGDHKSTSDIKRWAKTPEVLESDCQAIIYAQNALMQWPDVMQVDLEWHYTQTKGPKKSKLVPLRLSRAHVSKEFEKIELDAIELVATYNAKPDPLSLAPTRNSCNNYGGCPFKSKCNFGPDDNLATLFQKDLENMNTSAPTVDFLSRLSPTVVIPDRPEQLPLFVVKDSPIANPFPKTDQPINPPEYQPPPPSGSAAITMVVSEPCADKPKRGRPSKKVKEPEVVGGIVVGSIEVTPVDEGKTYSGFTLYIDCMPMGNKHLINLAHLAAEANETIKSKLEVPEWRIGEPVGFGRANGFLSAAVLELALDRNCDIYLDSATPEGNACKSALMAAAGAVVVGLR